MDEKERSKERGNKSALSYFLYSHFYTYCKHRLKHKQDHQYSQRPERQPRCDLLHHIEQSVRMIIHNQPRRSSVLTHASFSFHRDIHISVHLFLSTLLLLFVSFIVCRYVHVECTDERKSKVHRYSQRLREMSERNTQTHIARLPALKTPYSQTPSNSPWFVWHVSYKRETVRLVSPLGIYIQYI
jgi:hypothetical protein